MSYAEVINCFSNRLKIILEHEIKNNGMLDNIEEIRVRNNLPMIIKSCEKETILDYKVTREEMSNIIQRVCENSLYSYQKQISEGYITIKGGNRVGIVGSGVMKDSEVINLNYISSLNFRISRQVIGCSNCIMNEILNYESNEIFNTLIASPPGVGKTTLLKDIVRNLSNGISNFKGISVSVIDERGEIGACYKGTMQNDLGIRTDILDNVPKAIGMKMVIRSMSPKVIVADEIGSDRDVDAIKYAMRCGVKGIFTAHAQNLENLKANPELGKLIEEKIFERIIVIKRRIGGHIDKTIYKN